METHRVGNCEVNVVKVLVDTNFLLAPFSLGLDLFSELDRVIVAKYEVVVLDCVLRELKELARRGGKIGRMARSALELVDRANVKFCSFSCGGVDESILNYAKKVERCVVATNDRELRRKLREAGVAVVFLRQEDHLALDGEVL